MAHGDHLKYSGKPKAGKKTFLRLISYVACDRRLLIVIGVLIVISIAANLTGSYMLRPIINEYILPGDFQGLVRILLFLAAIYLTGVAATYIEYILLNKIGQRTVTRMREELFGKMERLPVRYFDTHQHGDVMSRYTNDIDRISDALTDSLSDMLSSALTVIGIFCLMIFISPILTAVTLITVPPDVPQCQRHCETEPEILQSAAGSTGNDERLCGRNDQRTESGESIRTRTEGGNRLRDTEPKPEGQIVESTILLGANDACHAKPQYAELCDHHHCGGFTGHLPRIRRRRTGSFPAIFTAVRPPDQ